jgi:hypothetical protein
MWVFIRRQPRVRLVRWSRCPVWRRDLLNTLGTPREVALDYDLLTSVYAGRRERYDC